jgi:HlyD family secretion protein
VTSEKPSVLKVPNAALRFRPSGAEPGPSGPAGGRGSGGGNVAAPSGGGGGGAGGGRQSIEQIRERLVKGLALTEEQQKKLEPILQDSREQMGALRGLSISDSERQAKMQKIRENSRARIRELLTPAQQAKYDEMSPGGSGGGRGGGGAGRVWIVGPDGKPASLNVTLGISDGSATEIVRGDVKEGQDVIVGVTGAAGRTPGQGQQPSGSAPRLRL